MSKSHVEVWLRNSECNLLKTCWRTDLVIQACNGSYLVDTFPEIIAQLQERYGKPATVRCTSEFPVTDQGSKTLSFQVGSSTAEQVTFSAGTSSLAEIYAQMKAGFQNVEIKLEGDIISVATKQHGPEATLTISGDCELTWGPILAGSGYTIKSHYYQNAQRIMLFPGGGETLNHIEMDIPPGCYKIWTRVCHGNNEETSLSMVKFDGCGCYEVNLLLPTIKTCSAQVVHPLMDKVVYEGALADVEERLALFKGVMFGANLGKQAVVEQLAYRREEAVEKGDSELQARVEAVQNLANMLPECY